ncbi:putative fibroblast growth factor 23-like [Scophthalmus maximus]|uniref:Putative fibroblast growth factor 23-like n=1 Tax=Scophthalmus maximus TaxID=52904 RepID=A0A2U9BYQ9_SCOMX|nr:putative fibroblast growth factor 23-like [Scophthalmus maximus]
MRPAFFSLLLAAVHVSVLVDCRPRPRDPERPPDPRRSGSHAGRRADTPAVRTDTSVFVSIFDLRRKRFLCMDFKGELYMSRQRDKGECLFQRVWVDVANHHDVFYSASGGELLKLEGAERHRERPGRPPAAPRERVLGPSARRQRRSDEVNPSDPLRTHSHPSGAAKDQKDAASPGQPEQDQAGAVSKETITSCDDPLRVLQPNGPVSPVKTNIADRAEQD